MFVFVVVVVVAVAVNDHDVMHSNSGNWFAAPSLSLSFFRELKATGYDEKTEWIKTAIWGDIL